LKKVIFGRGGKPDISSVVATRCLLLAGPTLAISHFLVFPLLPVQDEDVGEEEDDTLDPVHL